MVGTSPASYSPVTLLRTVRGSPATFSLIVNEKYHFSYYVIPVLTSFPGWVSPTATWHCGILKLLVSTGYRSVSRCQVKACMTWYRAGCSSGCTHWRVTTVWHCSCTQILMVLNFIVISKSFLLYFSLNLGLFKGSSNCHHGTI